MRLRDSQLGEARAADIQNYIRRGKLWEAFDSEPARLLLIEKSIRPTSNFRTTFCKSSIGWNSYVYELNKTVKARQRPIIIITSNNEKELPDAFLRRCFFHYIRFPDDETMKQIIEVHFPAIKARLVSEALKVFYDIAPGSGPEEKAQHQRIARLAQIG